MATYRSSWNSLLVTLNNGHNNDFKPIIHQIQNHAMYSYANVPKIYNTIYDPQTKNHRLIYMHKKITLDRILSMLDGMMTGI